MAHMRRSDPRSFRGTPSWKLESRFSPACQSGLWIGSGCKNASTTSAKPQCLPTMHAEGVPRRLAAELIGSVLLAATVVGSGIMAERLAGGNVAVALLANTAATVAVLATLIALLGPVSGAHFNPAVSLVQALRGGLPWREACVYAVIQVAGCSAGAILAHAMFSLPLIQSSVHERTGIAQWLAEYVATLGLLLVILGHRKAQDAPLVGAARVGGGS